MNTHTITLTIHSGMTTEEVEQWIHEARDDMSLHLIEDETLEVQSVKEVA